MGLLRKIGRAVGKIFPGTGRHAAKRAQKAADQYAAEAAQQRVALEEKNKKERKKAQRLAIRGMRSRRAASFFNAPTEGSATIG